jgi:pimeloyl-ACP methyl ester carboxylesterase
VQAFDSDGVSIRFIDEGSGDPVLLVHGFASSVKYNWIDPGWVSLLRRNAYRVIAYDNRGHGESAKLYDPQAYQPATMMEDARRLLDHLGIARADVMGYSMGARITAFFALAHPERLRSAIFGGLGGNMLRPMAGTGADRARARGQVDRRGRQSDRAHLPRLCGKDRQRSCRAGRVHPRFPRADQPRDGRQN